MMRSHESNEVRRLRFIGNRIRLPRSHNIGRATLDPFVPIQPFSAGELQIVCDHCGSLSFLKEKFNCCHSGKVSLDTPPFPPELYELFTANSQLSNNFLTNIRRINTAMSFASLQSKLVLPPGSGPPVFRIHGQLYHNYAALYPNNQNQSPSFS